MVRGRDHFSVRLREKNRQREKERKREKVKKLNEEESQLLWCVKTTIARESRIDFDVTPGRTFNTLPIVRVTP